MKNLNVMWIHWKIRFLWGGGRGGGVGGHEKTIYRGNCLKREAWSVCKFKGGGLAKKEVDGVFEEGGGGDTPMHTMATFF